MGDEQASDTFSPEDGKVAIRDADGSVWKIPAEQLPKAVSEGATPATEAQYWGAKLGETGTAVAAGAGAARGLSFGASDPLYIETARALGGDANADDTRHVLNLLREAHPNADTAGETAGMLAPLLVGDPFQALDAGAGRVIEGAGARVLGESTAARALTRFAAGAPTGALIGGLAGAGHEWSEDALGDHDVTAEKMLASAEGGAVFGGLLGGAFHSASGFMGDLAGRSEDGLQRYGGAAERGALKEGERTAYRSAAALPEEAAAGVEGGERGWLGKLADRQAFEATGAAKADYARLGATGEAQMAEAERLGARLRDEGIVTPLASKTDMAERVKTRLDEVGKELSDLRRPLDTTSVRPSLSAIESQARETILKPLEAVPATEVERAQVEKFLGEMRRLSGDGDPTFDQLYKFRRRIDNVLNPKRAKGMVTPMAPGYEQLNQLRGIVEGEYERAGAEAAKELGTDFSSKYTIAKGLYSDLAVARKVLSGSVRGAAANQGISLTDVIAGGAALAHGGPAALAVGALNHVRRVYGNQIAAHVLDKASRLEGIQRVSAQVDSLIGKGVKGFLEGERSGPRIARESAQKVTGETIQQIREAARNPEALSARVAHLVGGADLAQHAPRTATALATTITRLATYLGSQMPPDAKPSGLNIVPQKPRNPSAHELARASDIIQVADDPLSVAEDLRSGRVSRAKVEALQAIYPKIYESIRQSLTDHAVELRPELSLQQQLALSVLFGAPVAKALEPPTLAGLQATYAKGGKTADETAPQGGAQPPPQGVPFKRERGSMLSGFDQMEAGT